MKAAVRVASILVPLIFACGPAGAGYDRFVDIHPNGWTESVALCINARGEVAGYGVTAQGDRGFVWSGGTATAILPPGADSARAAWINANGDIAGTAVTGGVPHAFVLKNGRYEDPTPGWAFSTGDFVGDDGTVTGSGEFGAYALQNGATVLLPGFSKILGGNSAGQYIGLKDDSARLYTPLNGYTDLTPPTTVAASPGAINESGLVALTSSTDGVRKGFVYSGGWFIQMTPPGWEMSQATAINNAAAVVGFGDFQGTRQSFVRTGADYAFLAFPGWTATEAVSLNDLGQVAGSGRTASGERHAFVASRAETSAAQGSAPPPSAEAGGGCAMAPRASSAGSAAAPAVNLAILASPLLVPLARRIRR